MNEFTSPQPSMQGAGPLAVHVREGSREGGRGRPEASWIPAAKRFENPQCGDETTFSPPCREGPSKALGFEAPFRIGGGRPHFHKGKL
jgi:hypothetical protein